MRWMRGARVLLLSAVLAIAPATMASAWSWSTCKDTGSPLSSSYLHGSPVDTIWGYSMTACSSGFTKYMAIHNGGFVVHGHVYQGTGCFSFGQTHGHGGSYAVCKSVTTTGNNYANCRAGR